jgi:hypothetical protein
MSNGTTSACNRTHRPDAGCPIVNAGQGCDGAKCELRTISASQFSSATVLLVTLALFAYSAVSKADPENHDFAVHAALFLLGTVAYYFIGSWQIEEEHIVQLRTLHPQFAWAEIIFRVGILALLGVASALLDWLAIFDLHGVSAELTFLVIIFVSFLAWDAIVAFGDQNGKQLDLAWRFFVMDIIGAAIILASLWSVLFDHSNVRALSDIGAIIFVIVALIRTWRPFLKPLLARIAYRNLLR